MKADRIRQLTAGFQARTDYPPALYAFLEAHGVDPARSVLVEVSQAEQGINPIVGLVLTQDQRFMEFDLDLDPEGRRVLEVHCWSDRSEEQNTCGHNPGFGKGRGFLALEVQRELAGCS